MNMKSLGLDKLLDKKEAFYVEYGKLVAKTLEGIEDPEEFQEMEMLIQETSNVYSSCYEDYLKKGKKKAWE